MNDTSDFNNQGQNMDGGFDPNRPRLKKVKRPIKRDFAGSVGNAPVSPSPEAPSAPSFTQAQPPRAADFEPLGTSEVGTDDFNLDSYLDESSNLPTVQNDGRKFDPRKPQFVDDSELEEAAPQSGYIIDGMFTKKAIGIIAAVVFVIGFLFAKMFFTEEKVVRDGLQGVIINAEVPRGRARCGVAEKTQGCVLYIMNPQRQELNARDFYDLAAQLTGRQRFLIETGNMRYSAVKIRPGEIAQLNIPPLQ